jgi:hypothetical protein
VAAFERCGSSEKGKIKMTISVLKPPYGKISFWQEKLTALRIAV